MEHPIMSCRAKQLRGWPWLQYYCSVVRGAASALDLGLGKIPSPSSPTQLNFSGWWNHGRSLPRPTPVGAAHIAYNYTPDSLLQYPSPSFFLCVLLSLSC